MSKKIFKDNKNYNAMTGGSHLKSSNNSRNNVPYYAKNRSPMGQLQGRQVHKRATDMFSMYDTSAIKPKNNGKKTAAIVLAILAVVVVVLLLANVFHLFEPDPKADVTPGVEVSVTIPSGASTSQIAQTLFDNDVIRRSDDFTNAVKSKGVDSKLKPGTYTLLTLMDTDDLIETLVAGPAFYGTKLTIPEGYTISETAATVQSTLGISSEEFLKKCASASSYVDDYPFLKNAYNDSLEGYLFPKTYDVPDGATADTVIKMMLSQYETELNDLGLSSSGANGYSLAEITTIASMIQGETSETSEMATVASVIYNRLKQGIALQIDATVVYALGADYSGKSVTYDDLEVDSPYNTYKNAGLPPGPINSPGADALKAAMNPESTNYLYYLAPTGSTTHKFFEDYDSFLEAKAQQ